MNLLNGYILVKEAQKKEESAFATASAINDLLGRGEVVGMPLIRKIQHQVADIYSVSDGEVKDLCIGSTVYFEKNIGNEFELEGQKVKFVKLEDIMGYE